MPVDPPARDDGRAVERCDRGLGEQRREQVADDAADRMRRKDVERLVDVQEELEARREVCADGRDEADGDGG